MPFYSVHPTEDEENSGCLYEICIDRGGHRFGAIDISRERDRYVVSNGHKESWTCGLRAQNEQCYSA